MEDGREGVKVFGIFSCFCFGGVVVDGDGMECGLFVFYFVLGCIVWYFFFRSGFLRVGRFV